MLNLKVDIKIQLCYEILNDFRGIVVNNLHFLNLNAYYNDAAITFDYNFIFLIFILKLLQIQVWQGSLNKKCNVTNY